MKQEEIKDKNLQELFSQTVPEKFPVNLNNRIMKRVVKIQKKREWRNFIGLSLFSLSLITAIVFALSYFTSFNLAEIFGTLFTGTKEDIPSGIPFYLLICGIAIVLLLLDYQLRKLTKRNEKK